MKTNKDICAELKRVFCIYEIGNVRNVTIVDEVLLREWRAFHDTHARYRALCKSCHA